MELTLSVHDDLAQLLALLYSPCGILLPHTLQSIHHLLCLSLVDGLDGAAVLGVGVLYEVEAILAILAVERVAGLHVLQLHGAANIACHQFLHLDTVGSGAYEELCHTFLAAAISVAQVVSLVYLAAHNLEILHLTDVRLHSCLEEEQAGGAFLAGYNLLAAGIEHARHLIHKGYYVAQELHQAAHTHILAGAHTEDGEHATCCQALADTLAHLVLGKCIALEELLHQSLIVLGSSLHQCLVHLVGLFHLVGRHIFDSGLTAIGTP